jgi:hypothetical protein
LGAIESGVGELFEQHVGLAMHDSVAPLDGRKAEGLGKVTLACTWGAQENVFVLLDEVRGGEVEDEAADCTRAGVPIPRCSSAR